MSDPNANPPTPPGALSYKDDPDFLPWLKTQEGFKDLFEPPGTPPAPVPAPAPVATGGGHTVPANQSAEVMGDVVSSVTKAIAEGAVKAAAAIGIAASASAQPVADPPKKRGFWG